MLYGKRALVILLGFTAVIALAVVLADPLTEPVPRYMAQMREWAAHGRIADTFTPLAYPLFGGFGYKLAGVPGVLGLQAMLHVAIAATSYTILRRLQLPARWAAAGTVPLALHPELLSSIAKTWDVAFTTELYLLIALSLLLLGEKPRVPLELSAAVAGLALGAGFSARPNFFLLALLFVWCACRATATTLPRRILGVCTLMAVTAATFVTLGAAEHGHAFVAKNGPVNVYAGHNAFTAQALLQQENAEPSVVHAYQAAMAADPALPRVSEYARDYYIDSLRPFYVRSAEQYALHHPLDEAGLAAVKLFTLFRPDTKLHPLASAAGMAKALLALPALVLATAIFWRPRLRLHSADHVLLLLDALYVLPFLLTNADPRFRTPLDALMILQTVRLLWLRFGATANEVA